jgi:preprotein translocase subunit SecA
VLGYAPRDQQILASLAIIEGKLVELHNGEGKTLAVALAAVYCAQRGERVHVLTANDFLARRDALTMADLYTELGISSGFLAPMMGLVERHAAYSTQVLYATVAETGFDYLMDQTVLRPSDLIQPPLGRAIVDDAETVMLDQSRTSLVVAAGESAPAELLYRAANVARWLRAGIDYRVDEDAREVTLTDAGMARVEFDMQCGHLHQPQNAGVFTAVADALHAQVLIERDVDYAVRQGGIEFTGDYVGRLTDRQRWPGGLQSAVEAKEGVRFSRPGRILNSILVQNFLRLYDKLSAASGCAATDADRFRAQYGLQVIQIPPHQPAARADRPDLVFTHLLAKWRAIVEEVDQCHAAGRPVLVNTATVEESEDLSKMLTERNIEHHVIHGGRTQAEAAVAGQAARPRAVTIATAGAGLGVVVAANGGSSQGGLYIIGSVRRDCRRIDLQVRARAGAGSGSETRFFLSLEDDLIVRFGLQPVLRNAPAPGRVLEDIQWVIETQAQDILLMLARYEQVLEDQRRLMYALRRAVLFGESGSLLERNLMERYLELAQTFGEAEVKEAERRVRLETLDELWADFLAWVADFRAGVHWPSWGSREPLRRFRIEAEEKFAQMLRAHEEEVVAYLDLDRLPEILPVHLDRRAIWTYALPDQPTGLIRERLGMLVRKRLVALGVLQQ